MPQGHRHQPAGKGRFAPSTTGVAHPGTLLAALLCWLDARSRGDRVLLRLENLDPARCRVEYATAMLADLSWLGLDWDEVLLQSDASERHCQALDYLAERGVLYPSPTTRGELALTNETSTRGKSPERSYDNRDREQRLPAAGWRACSLPLRVRLPDEVALVRDESGSDLSQNPAAILGDPVVRRRDGAIAYHLAVVVDDAASAITRIVRGRDIATSTATQVALQKMLGLPTPHYRHHLLLLEERERKLAKLHGSVGAPELRQHYSGPALCGVLSQIAGLRRDAQNCSPTDLVAEFSWESVRSADVLVRWTGSRLLVDHVMDSA